MCFLIHRPPEEVRPTPPHTREKNQNELKIIFCPPSSSWQQFMADVYLGQTVHGSIIHINPHHARGRVSSSHPEGIRSLLRLSYILPWLPAQE